MILKDFLLGVLTSTIPIFILTTKSKDFCNKEILNFIAYLPFLLGIINIFIYAIAETLISEYNLDKSFRFLLAGLLAGFIYSSIVRFNFDIPDKVLGMDPNKFQIYAMIVWLFIYAFIDYLRNQL